MASEVLNADLKSTKLGLLLLDSLNLLLDGLEKLWPGLNERPLQPTIQVGEVKRTPSVPEGDLPAFETDLDTAHRRSSGSLDLHRACDVF